MRQMRLACECSWMRYWLTPWMEPLAWILLNWVLS